MTTPFVGKLRPLHPPCKASFATALDLRDMVLKFSPVPLAQKFGSIPKSMDFDLVGISNNHHQISKHFLKNVSVFKSLGVTDNSHSFIGDAEADCAP